jgi:hypothetical protein
VFFYGSLFCSLLHMFLFCLFVSPFFFLVSPFFRFLLFFFFFSSFLVRPRFSGYPHLFLALAHLFLAIQAWPGPSFTWGGLPTGSKQSWSNGEQDARWGEAAGTRVGIKSVRPKWSMKFQEDWRGTRDATFDLYQSVGERVPVFFIIDPPIDKSKCPPTECVNPQTDAWKTYKYPPKNLYEPIWDPNDNSKPNPNNYWASFVWIFVNDHKHRFDGMILEVWNEPDFINNGLTPWAVTQKCRFANPCNSDNWWSRPPLPSELITWGGTIFEYNRLLHISYVVAKRASQNIMVATGGLGYEGFTDAICRYTERDPALTYTNTVDLDNVNTGCEYFDVMSTHYYAHAAGTRHNSDDTAIAMSQKKLSHDAVLRSYGYDGVQKPAKHAIMTETGISDVPIDNYGGSALRQGYMIKAGVLASINGLRQVHWFCIGSFTSTNPNAFTNMGLFDVQTTHTSATVPMKASTQAMVHFQMTFRIGEKVYDAVESGLLGLPAGVKGFVFRGGPTPTLRVTVFWVNTTGRTDENAAPVQVTFNSPNAQATVATWNNQRSTVNLVAGSFAIQATASPKYLQEPDFVTGAATNPPATTLASTNSSSMIVAQTTAISATTTAAATMVAPTTATAATTTAAVTTAGGATSGRAVTTTAAAAATTVGQTTPAASTNVRATTVAATTPAAAAITSGQTTPAAATSVRATTAAAMTTAAATTIAAATTTDAVTTAAGATTVGAPCVIPVMAQPGTPCSLECCPNVPGRRRVAFKMR